MEKKSPCPSLLKMNSHICSVTKVLLKSLQVTKFILLLKLFVVGIFLILTLRRERGWISEIRLIYRVNPGQQELHRETMSWKTKEQQQQQQKLSQYYCTDFFFQYPSFLFFHLCWWDLNSWPHDAAQTTNRGVALAFMSLFPNRYRNVRIYLGCIPNERWVMLWNDIRGWV